jgi:hypothetical protein
METYTLSYRWLAVLDGSCCATKMASLAKVVD